MEFSLIGKYLSEKINKVFKYIEPLWLGGDKKISLRRLLACYFSLDLVENASHAIQKWEAGRSYADVAMLLGIEAGLVAALLTLTTYSSTLNKFKPE